MAEIIARHSFVRIESLQKRVVFSKSIQLSLRVLFRDHSFSKLAKFSEKLLFLTPWYPLVRMRIKGKEMLFFLEILQWMIPYRLFYVKFFILLICFIDLLSIVISFDFLHILLPITHIFSQIHFVVFFGGRSFYFHAEKSLHFCI